MHKATGLRLLWRDAKESPSRLTARIGKVGRVCTLEYLKQHGKTGDLLLLSGIGLNSTAVRYVSHSRWSHTAVLIRLDAERLYVLESSNGHPDYDVLHGAYVHTGVHMWPVENLLQYQGRAIVWRPLQLPHDSWRQEPEWQYLNLTVIQRLSGRLYDTHLIEMLKSTWFPPESELREMVYGEKAPERYAQLFDLERLKVLDTPRAQELYCSELVPLYYQALGLLDTHRAAQHYSLDDLWEEDRHGRATDLQFRYRQARLGRSVYLLEALEDYEYARDEKHGTRLSTQQTLELEGRNLVRQFHKHFCPFS